MTKPHEPMTDVQQALRYARTITKAPFIRRDEESQVALSGPAFLGLMNYALRQQDLAAHYKDALQRVHHSAEYALHEADTWEATA